LLEEFVESATETRQVFISATFAAEEAAEIAKVKNVLQAQSQGRLNIAIDAMWDAYIGFIAVGPQMTLGEVE
jgi:hypothetical protein